MPSCSIWPGFMLDPVYLGDCRPNPQAFMNFDWKQILVTYMSVPLVLVLYFWYKIKHHTKIIPLDEVDVSPSHKDQNLSELNDK